MPIRCRASLPTFSRNSARPVPRGGPRRHALRAPSGVNTIISRMKTKIPGRRPAARWRGHPLPPPDRDPNSGGRGRRSSCPISRQGRNHRDHENQSDHAAEITETPGDVGHPAGFAWRERARGIIGSLRRWKIRPPRWRGGKRQARSNRLDPGTANQSIVRQTIWIDREEARSTASCGGLVGDGAGEPATGWR